MTVDEQLLILDEILNFELKEIPAGTRFWMVRTKGGYFYNEFVTKRFVALAWNTIDNNTDFSEDSRDLLKDDIMMEYPEIKRPSTVINKCHTFIHEIKKGDILVIPSAKSGYITFAIAGDYYEDTSKSIELEHTVISRIENNDVDINDVSCPYKKRRHIELLRTVANEYLNYSLCRALTSYHGVSCLDAYSKQILNSLYNFYKFQNNISLVYNVKKTGPISPREINSVLYGATELLALCVPEERISTQLSLNSPGEIVFSLSEAIDFLAENWKYFAGILVIVGGGSVATLKFPGLIEIVKSVLNAPAEHRIKNAEAEQKELEVLEKKYELYEKIKSSGISPEALKGPIEALASGCRSLDVQPITLGDNASAIPLEAVEAPESLDREDE